MSGNITQTFLIECNRENSVEIKNYGVDNPLSNKDTAEWTNILKNCNLKKGDILQMDNAVINARGSNTSAMEFTGLNVDNERLYTDNFAIMKFAHYISNNNEYSVGLPFSNFWYQSTTEQGLEQKLDGTAMRAGGQQGDGPPLISNLNYSPGGVTTNFEYGKFICPTYNEGGVDYQYIYNSPSVPAGFGRFDGFMVGGFTIGIGTQSCNSFSIGDCKKFALLNPAYLGPFRPTMDPASWTADLYSGEARINIEIGYEDPNSVADTLTQSFLQTNAQDNQIAVQGQTLPSQGTTKVNIAQFTGQMVKQIPVNGQIRNNVYYKGNLLSLTERDAFYQGLAVDEPIRYSTGVNIYLQADLVDVGTDVTAFRSPARTSPPFNATFVAGSNQAIFQYDATTYPDFRNKLRVGMEINITTASGAVLDPGTLITSITYIGATNNGAMNISSNATGTTNPGLSTIANGVGNGAFQSNIPVYLFANADNQNSQAAIGYDEYSPHTDIENEFDITNMTFTDGGTISFKFENVGYKTFVGNVDYNYNVLDTNGDIIYYAKWTGTNANEPENYFISGTPDNYFTFTFSFDNGPPSQIFIPASGTTDVYDYDNGPSNPWTNQDGDDRTFTLIGGTIKKYLVTSTTPTAYTKLIEPEFGNGKKVDLMSTEGTLLGTGTLNDGLTTITFSPAIVLYDLDNVLFFDITLQETVRYLAVTEQTVGNANINTELRRATDNTLLNYLYYNQLLDSSENKIYDTTGNLLNKKIIVNYQNDGLDGTTITYINYSTGANEVQNWTNQFELFRNPTFEGWDGVAMPEWNLTPSPASYDATDLANGIITTTGGPYIKQTSITGLVVGGVYEITVRREDALANSLIIRSTNGGAYVNVLWDNGSTGSLRYLGTNGAGQISPTISFEVLTACDGIDIGFAALGQSLSEASMVQNVGAGVAVNRYTESEWNVNGAVPLPQNAIQYNLTSTDTAQNLSNRYANMGPHQIIPTNIEYNEKNLQLLQKFFQGTEEYIGSDTDLASINRSSANFVCQMDMGRTKDEIWSSTKILENFEDEGNAMVNAWQPFQAGTDGETFVCPRLTPDEQTEQRFQVYSRFLAGGYDRLKYGRGLPNSPDLDLKSLRFTNRQKFYFNNPVTGAKYDESLSAKYKIAVYPVYYIINNDELNPPIDYEVRRVCAFDLYTDMRSPQDKYLKIMWGTSAIFSPQFADHNQVWLCNNEDSGAPLYVTAEQPPDPQVVYDNDIEKFNSFIGIGASDMSCSYNNSLSRFQFLNWHVSKFLNSGDGAADQLGQSICSFLSRPQGPRLIPSDDYTNFPQFANNRNPNLNDAQCGNALIGIFFQTENINITDSDDSRAIEASRDKFYGSLFWKMGYTYEDLFPIRFSTKPFRNRFNQFAQNNYSSNQRHITESPLTTNSDVNISALTSTSIYPVNEAVFDDTNTATILAGKPKFGLGGNNGQPINIDVESSAITATNLQVELNNGFYRVYCDLPMSCFNYVAAEQDLPAIGVCLRNYSTGGFFYGYATSYEIQITRDMPLNSIRTIIRDGNGKVARNLNEKCCIFYKITRTIPIGEQRSEESLLLEELVKETKESNVIAENEAAEMNRNLELLQLPVAQRVMINNIENELLDQIIDSQVQINKEGIIANPEKAARNVVQFFEKNGENIKTGLSILETATTKIQKRQALDLLKAYIPSFEFKISDLSKPEPWTIRNKPAVDLLKSYLYAKTSTPETNIKLIRAMKKAFREQTEMLRQQEAAFQRQARELKEKYGLMRDPFDRRRLVSVSTASSLKPEIPEEAKAILREMNITEKDIGEEIKQSKREFAFEKKGTDIKLEEVKQKMRETGEIKRGRPKKVKQTPDLPEPKKM